MKLFALSCVLVSGAVVEHEQSSLLQSTSKKHAHNQVEIPVVLDRAAIEMSELDADASQETVDAALMQTFQRAKATSTSVLQLPEMEQIALLRRAGQGEELDSFRKSFANLPANLKQKVVKAVRSSQDMLDVFDSLPDVEQHIILSQIEQQPGFDNSLPKNRPKTTRTYETLDNGVVQKTTRTENGAYVHEHKSSKYGVSSTTQGKNGYRHSHSHKHNGYGGNAKTETVSSKGSWKHEHRHDHDYNPSTGITKTRTETVSEGDGILDLTHTHDHEHRHVADIGTETKTRSVTDSAVGTHRHNHNHWHNERTGEFDSDSDSNSDGPKWDQIR